MTKYSVAGLSQRDIYRATRIVPEGNLTAPEFVQKRQGEERSTVTRSISFSRVLSTRDGKADKTVASVRGETRYNDLEEVSLSLFLSLSRSFAPSDSFIRDIAVGVALLGAHSIRFSMTLPRF